MRLRTTATILLALVAGLAGGCGSDDEQRTPIPAQAAADLEARLDEVQRRLDNGSFGACEEIGTDSAPGVEAIISSLPEDVDADIRQALEDGFERLFALSVERCAEIESEQPETETETVPEPPPETETLPETETETTPTVPETETETTPTIPDEVPIPPEEQPGDEGGSGGAATPGEGDG